jgi:hypothetical protein
MPRSRFPLVRLLAVGAALGTVLLLLALWRPPGRADGELWRRGQVAGEQVLLRRDGRYELQRWSWFGRAETFEAGTWVQLGEVVSLVPSTGGRPTRLMRKEVRDDTRYLVDPAGSTADARYERVD